MRHSLGVGQRGDQFLPSQASKRQELGPLKGFSRPLNKIAKRLYVRPYEWNEITREMSFGGEEKRFED